MHCAYFSVTFSYYRHTWLPTHSLHMVHVSPLKRIRVVTDDLFTPRVLYDPWPLLPENCWPTPLLWSPICNIIILCLNCFTCLVEEYWGFNCIRFARYLRACLIEYCRKSRCYWRHNCNDRMLVWRYLFFPCGCQLLNRCYMLYVFAAVIWAVLIILYIVALPLWCVCWASG